MQPISFARPNSTTELLPEILAFAQDRSGEAEDRVVLLAHQLDPTLAQVKILGLTLIERMALAFRDSGPCRLTVVVDNDRGPVAAAVRRSRRLAGMTPELIACDAAAGALEALATAVPGARESILVGVVTGVFESRAIRRFRERASGEPDRVHWSSAPDQDVPRVMTDAGGGQPRTHTGLFYLPAAWLDEQRSCAEAPDLPTLIAGAMKAGVARECELDDLVWRRVTRRGAVREAARALLRSTAKPTDGPVSRVINRPLSQLSSALLIRLGVTPNGVTTGVFAIGFLAAWLAAQGSVGALLACALFTQLASVWDGCDGEIARVTHRSSRFGTWYDTVTDNIRYAALIIGVAVGCYHRQEDALYLALGGLFFVLVGVLFGSMYWHLRRNGSAGTHLVILGRIEDRAATWQRIPGVGLLFRVRVLSKQDVTALAAAVLLALQLPEVLLVAAVVAVAAMLGFVLPVLQDESRTRAARPPWQRARMLFLVAGLLGVVWVVSRFPLVQIGDACRTMGWAVLATPLVAFVWLAANTTGTYLLFTREIPWRVLFANRLMGEGYNALVPLGGVAGEPVKAQHLRGYRSSDQVVAVVVLDRLVNTLSSLIFSALVIGWTVAQAAWPYELEIAAYAYVGLASVGATGLLVFGLSRAPQRVGAWVQARLADGAPPSKLPSVPVTTFALALGWHIVGRIAVVLEVVLLLYLLELPFGTLEVAAITGLVSAAGVLAFLIPQSLGAAEAAAVYAFYIVGFPMVAGAAFALVRRGRTLAISILGVGMHLSRGAIGRWARQRSVSAGPAH